MTNPPRDVKDVISDLQAEYRRDRAELEAKLEDLRGKLRKYRAALPEPQLLETLAVWFDARYPNDPHPEVQADLRKWASRARELLAEKL